MFIPIKSHERKWDADDEQNSFVAAWFDGRGNRFFLVRRSNNRYDFKVVVEGETRAHRRGVSSKAVTIAARTLGILISPEEVEALTRSTVARRIA